MNIALADRLLPGGDVLLLNPDARIDARSDRACCSVRCTPTPDLASVGPAQTDESGRPAAWSGPSRPANAWLEAVGLARLQRGPQFVIGSVLLLRAEALAQVGGFDERFFLYAEETDWAYRAHRAGLAACGGAEAHGRCTSAAARAATAARREVALPRVAGALPAQALRRGGWQVARAANWVGSDGARGRLSAARGRRRPEPRGAYRTGSGARSRPPSTGRTRRDAHRADRSLHRLGERRRRSGVEPRARVPRDGAHRRVVHCHAHGGVPAAFGRKHRFLRALALFRRMVWFTTVGTVRARRFLAERPDAVSICHNNAMVGDIYVNHGVVGAAMRARGNGVWRMVRNPTHIFTFLRDLDPLPQRHPPRGGRAVARPRPTRCAASTGESGRRSSSSRTASIWTRFRPADRRGAPQRARRLPPRRRRARRAVRRARVRRARVSTTRSRRSCTRRPCCCSSSEATPRRSIAAAHVGRANRGRRTRALRRARGATSRSVRRRRHLRASQCLRGECARRARGTRSGTPRGVHPCRLRD